MNTQENYQLLLEKAFSGGYRNPILRPELLNNPADNFQVGSPNDAHLQLANFGGLATMIPERSAIQGKLPFTTNFTLGNGEIYFYKGKKTFDSWYNMGQQDFVPTYRWLVTEAGKMETAAQNIDVRFTHEDAYIGGSSIRLSGAANTTGTDIVLYRTKLEVSAANPKATIAVKSGVEGANASELYVIIKKQGSTEWVEAPVGELAGAAWETKQIALTGLAQGDVIEHIGLRVKGSNAAYKMLIGQLTISDDIAASSPAPIDENSLVTEIKEETKTSMSVKLNWSVDDTGFTTKYKHRGMVYNDEVNIHHFELLIKDGEDGKVYEIGRTTSWHAYLGNIDLNTYAEPYVGVRSVSTDLKTYSPIAWVKLARYENPQELPDLFVDRYGKTYINTNSENWQTALETRYFDRIYTTGAVQDLDYTRNQPIGAKDDPLNTNYVFEKDHVLKVQQGSEITFFFRGANLSDNVKYCFIKGYIDWDINYDFDASDSSDEFVFEGGEKNKGIEAIVNPGITVTIKVPADAVPGISRLRMVASDAWFAHPGPVGGTAKGVSVDFPVEIVGTNTPREPAKTYADYRDQGAADEVEQPSGIESVITESEVVMSAQLVGNSIEFNNVEKAWIYTTAGQFVKFVGDATLPVAVDELANGVYVVKMQNGQFIRSTKVIKK